VDNSAGTISHFFHPDTKYLMAHAALQNSSCTESVEERENKTKEEAEFKNTVWAYLLKDVLLKTTARMLNTQVILRARTHTA
jgi:hypothetical protein